MNKKQILVAIAEKETVEDILSFEEQISSSDCRDDEEVWTVYTEKLRVLVLKEIEAATTANDLVEFEGLVDYLGNDEVNDVYVAKLKKLIIPEIEAATTVDDLVNIKSGVVSLGDNDVDDAYEVKLKELIIPELNDITDEDSLATQITDWMMSMMS